MLAAAIHPGERVSNTLPAPAPSGWVAVVAGGGVVVAPSMRIVSGTRERPVSSDFGRRDRNAYFCSRHLP